MCSGVAFMGLIVAVVAGYKIYAKWYFTVPIVILFFFLVLHGGVGQTGLYWCLAFTPGMLYMVGPRVGTGLFSLGHDHILVKSGLGDPDWRPRV